MSKGKALLWVPGKAAPGRAYEYLLLGKVVVASYGWNSLRSRTDIGNEYSWTVLLPTHVLVDRSGYSPDANAAKASAEKVVRAWLIDAGLELK